MHIISEKKCMEGIEVVQFYRSLRSTERKLKKYIKVIAVITLGTEEDLIL